jgi:hypothetical protein
LPARCPPSTVPTAREVGTANRPTLPSCIEPADQPLDPDVGLGERRRPSSGAARVGEGLLGDTALDYPARLAGIALNAHATVLGYLVAAARSQD